MSNYDDYLFRSPLLEDYNDDEYIDPTPIYYNEEYNCFVDDYGNIYVLDEGFFDNIMDRVRTQGPDNAMRYVRIAGKRGIQNMGRSVRDWSGNNYVANIANRARNQGTDNAMRYARIAGKRGIQNMQRSANSWIDHGRRFVSNLFNKPKVKTTSSTRFVDEKDLPAWVAK